MSAGESAVYRFCLFVAGDAQNSTHAIANLGTICRDHLPENCEIEVVDVFKDPGRAVAAEVFMTPTLVKLAPGSIQRIVGSLSQIDIVLRALGVARLAA